MVSDNELRDVLVHELAHLERGDQRIVLLETLAGALYWPIVPVHGVNRELRRACEEVCDNVVLAGRDAIAYGETLLHVAELLVWARPIGAAVGMIGGQGELERRIAGLIDPRRNTIATTGRKAACVVMFLFFACGAITSATRFEATAAALAPSARTDAEVAAANPQEAGSPPRDIAEQAALPDVARPESASARTIVMHGNVLGPGDRPIARRGSI